MFKSGESDQARILYFSRGLGRGHAVKDIAIGEELLRLRGDVDIEFLSYSTGAQTFHDAGVDVTDLDLPDRSGFLEILVRAGAVLANRRRPDLVVCHEEFAVLPLARIMDVPSVLISHWFGHPEDLSMLALRYADRIIFIERKGLFDEPPYVVGKIDYVGPVVRRFSYRKTDRLRARQELRLSTEAAVISVLPGSGRSEELPALEEIVIPAFHALQAPDKRLVWIAGRDLRRLRSSIPPDERIILRETDAVMDRLMVASDVAITKATYTISTELAALGVPSISVSYGLNPMDDVFARRIATNRALVAKETTSRELTAVIEGFLRRDVEPDPAYLPDQLTGAPLAAKILACQA